MKKVIALLLFVPLATALFTTSTGITSTPALTPGQSVTVETTGWQFVYSEAFMWTGTQWVSAGTLTGPTTQQNKWLILSPGDKAQLTVPSVVTDVTLAIFACNEAGVRTYNCNGKVVLDANNQVIANYAKWMVYTVAGAKGSGATSTTSNTGTTSSTTSTTGTSSTTTSSTSTSTGTSTSGTGGTSTSSTLTCPATGIVGTSNTAMGSATISGPLTTTQIDYIEQQAHTLINLERTTRGLQALDWDTVFYPIPKTHSEDMVTRQFYNHVNPDGEDPDARAQRNQYRIGNHGLTCEKQTSATTYTYGIAENIARTPIYPAVTNCGSTETLDSLIECIVGGWMRSQHHCENILRPSFEWTGMGMAYYPVDPRFGGANAVYSTQNFC